jgi:hypothetical protein
MSSFTVFFFEKNQLIIAFLKRKIHEAIIKICRGIIPENHLLIADGVVFLAMPPLLLLLQLEAVGIIGRDHLAR